MSRALERFAAEDAIYCRRHLAGGDRAGEAPSPPPSVLVLTFFEAGVPELEDAVIADHLRVGDADVVGAGDAFGARAMRCTTPDDRRAMPALSAIGPARDAAGTIGDTLAGLAEQATGKDSGAAAARGDALAFLDADCRPVLAWLDAGLA
jgi:hypothetical protein